jgi:hypothetical protein
MVLSISGVDTQGEPYTATILWSIINSYLLHSASSPILITKYTILYIGISSQSLGSIKYLNKRRNIHHHHHHRLDSLTWALAFLRNFCQLRYLAIASSDFVTRVFSRMGLSAPRPTPGYLGWPTFFVRVVSLSRLVRISLFDLAI